MRDPLNPALHEASGTYHFTAGQWAEAIESYRTALRLSGEITYSHFGLGAALLYSGQVESALEAMQEEPNELLRLFGLALVRQALGHEREAEALLSRLIEKHDESPFGAYYVASVLAQRGDSDSAFEWLGRKAGSHVVENLSSNPLLGRLREDPRWQPFLERLGRAPAQLAAVEFEIPWLPTSGKGHSSG